jgi:hypothetical protein
MIGLIKSMQKDKKNKNVFLFPKKNGEHSVVKTVKKDGELEKLISEIFKS